MSFMDNENVVGVNFSAPPDLPDLANLIGLELEAALESQAKLIVAEDAAIEESKAELVEAGLRALKRAVALGCRLRLIQKTIKASKGHGHWMEWCENYLAWSMRKIDYYLMLERRYEGVDLDHAKIVPRSLREAFNRGLLPPDEAKKTHPAKEVDEWTPLRKVQGRCVTQIKKNLADPGVVKRVKPIVEMVLQVKKSWPKAFSEAYPEAAEPTNPVESSSQRVANLTKQAVDPKLIDPGPVDKLERFKSISRQALEAAEDAAAAHVPMLLLELQRLSNKLNRLIWRVKCYNMTGAEPDPEDESEEE